jgi:hypothetical protein
MLYPLIRKFFFSLDAETAHGIGMNGVDFCSTPAWPGCLAKPVAPARSNVMGLKFPNPVGLAAGLDKNGDHIDGLAASVSALSKSAPSRPNHRTATPSRACSASRKHRASSTAWVSTMPASTIAGKRPRRAVPQKGRHPRHQHRQERDDARSNTRPTTT